MRKIAFLPAAFDDYSGWAAEDKKIYARIGKLIKEIDRTPFSCKEQEQMKPTLQKQPSDGRLLAVIAIALLAI